MIVCVCESVQLSLQGPLVCRLLVEVEGDGDVTLSKNGYSEVATQHLLCTHTHTDCLSLTLTHIPLHVQQTFRVLCSATSELKINQ